MESKHKKPDHEKKSQRKRSNLLINLVVVGFVLLMLLLLLVFALNSKPAVPEPKCSGAQCPSAEPATETPTPTEISKYGCGDQGAASKNRVAYVKDNNVWIVNNDGSGKTQVTGDGGDDLIYGTPVWCSANTITYARCSNANCTVINHRLDNSSDQTLFFTVQGIDRISWSHDGTILANIGREPKEAEIITRIGMFKDGTNTNIKTFKPDGGRGIGLEDSESLEWSPDDSYLLVTDTFISDPHEDPIQVYKRDGSMLSSEPSPATHPTFGNESAYYLYKADNDINRQKISGGAWTKVFSGVQHGHNFAASANGKYIAYWNFDGKQLTLNAYETGKEVKVVGDNMSDPAWLNKDDKELIAIKTTPDNTAYEGVRNIGLVKVNRESGVIINLEDSDSIYRFAVER